MVSIEKEHVLKFRLATSETNLLKFSPYHVKNGFISSGFTFLDTLQLFEIGESYTVQLGVSSSPIGKQIILRVIYLLYICWLIINKPQPNFHSGDTSIQVTLALVARVSPQQIVFT